MFLNVPNGTHLILRIFVFIKEIKQDCLVWGKSYYHKAKFAKHAFSSVRGRVCTIISAE